MPSYVAAKAMADHLLSRSLGVQHELSRIDEQQLCPRYEPAMRALWH
jgi:hypothetical protein